jgi:hypothetical protein
MTLGERFDKFRDECDSIDSFQSIENKHSNRRDLHAFMLLDSIMPDKSDIVSGTDHYGIYLDIDTDELNEIITDEQVKELLKCGVCPHDDALYMFV